MIRLYIMVDSTFTKIMKDFPDYSNMVLDRAMQRRAYLLHIYTDLSSNLLLEKRQQEITDSMEASRQTEPPVIDDPKMDRAINCLIDHVHT